MIGCPISRSLATSCVCLELGSLPSPGVTRLHWYYEPLRHPGAPGLSLAGHRLAIPDHALGLPVLRALSLCTCCRHYPGAAAGRRLRSSAQAVSAFPGMAAGSACTSSFSRLARRSLALRPAHWRRSPIRDPLSEGFSHFVSSMTAPVASGWSDWPGGACTHWKAPPCHGARHEQTPFGLLKLPSRSPSFVDGEAESGVIEVGAYRASVYDCRGCPLKSKCCPKASPRKVLRSLYEEARDAACAITASEAYAND